MKIQCNSCETAEATVLCCADEAALCCACDEKVHAANKLASKHQRVPLSYSSSQMPKCDICQEAIGYFFCLEDRALLCRKCDFAIHTENPYVSGHQRFLLTGVKLGLEPTEPVSSSTKEKSNSVERTAESVSRTVPRRGSATSATGETSEVLLGQVDGVSGPPATKVLFSGSTTTGSIPEWPPLDEFLGFTDFNQNFAFMEHESSKADNGRLGDSEWSPILRTADADLDVNECFGQVPEITWMVPQIPSPPTTSGLYWPKNLRDPPMDSGVSVPDICYPSEQNIHRSRSNATISKRQRQY